MQDLAILPVNHPAGRAVAVAHTAAIAPASLLGQIVDREEAPEQDGFLRLPINSSHHQAVGIAGDGLHVSARCPQDAVIEAIEGGQATEGATAHFVLGVQWHPERSYEISGNLPRSLCPPDRGSRRGGSRALSVPPSPERTSVSLFLSFPKGICVVLPYGKCNEITSEAPSNVVILNAANVLRIRNDVAANAQSMP